MTATAGYSGTTLIRKLGFRPGWRILVSDIPDHYADLLDGAADLTFVQLQDPAADGHPAAHVFLHDTGRIAETAQAAIAHLAPGGMLWLSWAKKSSRLHTGVTEDMLREAVLPLSWVDVKVCAVDADWSGLKFLKRNKKRG